MIYDKIKIYVTQRVATILQRDAESFEFFKSDGMTPNRNALLTALIVNFTQEFSMRQNALDIGVSDILTRYNVSRDKRDEATAEIMTKINRELASDPIERFDCAISVKPTKTSQPIIDYTEAYLLKGNGLSEYYRNMFSTYASYSQDKREEIIFAGQYGIITQAINEGKRVFLSTHTDGRNKIEFSPFALSRSKEEMHIYLLGTLNGKCVSYKLCRIVSATMLQTPSVFTDDQISVFNKMQRYGPQFFYEPYDGEIVVRLTPAGKKRYRAIYVHRPIPCRVEDDKYYFDCSLMQVIQYFERFGCEAFVESPPSAQRMVYNFHRSAVSSYDKRRRNK